MSVDVEVLRNRFTNILYPVNVISAENQLFRNGSAFYDSYFHYIHGVFFILRGT